jgi:hypothetical protein
MHQREGAILGLFTAPFEGLRKSRSAAKSRDEVPTRLPSSSIGGTASRKQLLAIVLRETLLRNSIPVAWLGIEFFRTTDRSGTRTDGIHVRLMVRDGHPELPRSMVALERDFRRRVGLIDYRAPEWLQGVSWQFELPDEDAAFPGDAVAQDGDAAPDSAPPVRQHHSYGHTFTSTEPAPL